MKYFMIVILVLIPVVAGAEEIQVDLDITGANKIIIGNVIVNREGDNWRCVQEQPSPKPEPCKELTFEGTLKCNGVTMDLSDQPEPEVKKRQ